MILLIDREMILLIGWHEIIALFLYALAWSLGFNLMGDIYNAIARDLWRK